MNDINLASLREVKNILDRFSLRPQKKWGQNFLVDQNIVKKIMDQARVDGHDYILEIGPGLGVLTLPLASLAAGIVAVEKDRGLVVFLKDLFCTVPEVCIVEGDVQRLDLSRLVCTAWGEVKTVKVIANLPYYLTSSLIFRLLKGEVPWVRAVLMVQKEVAERIAATPGSTKYGSLTILCRFFTHVNLAFSVSRNVFYPSPRVDSAVITLEKKRKVQETGDDKLYIKLVSGVFQQRRKTILNALGHTFLRPVGEIREVLAGAHIDPNRRPDSMDSEEFANICRLIYNKNWQ